MNLREIEKSQEMLNCNFHKLLQQNSNPQRVLMKSLNLELEWHNLTLPVSISDEDRK